MKNKICIVILKNLSKIILIVLAVLLLNTILPSYIFSNFYASSEHFGLKLGIIIVSAIYLLIIAIQTMCEIDEIKKNYKE